MSTDKLAAERAALKPCPFCGERDQIPASNGFESHFIFCNQCGAEGPCATTEQGAAAGWNERGSIAAYEATKAAPAEPVGELDTYECSECCGKGWNWEPRQVGERMSDVQEFKIDCVACVGRGFVGPDAERRAAIESTPAQVDPCVLLWQAMNEAEKVGRRTDDKLIVKFLRDAGYAIAAAPAAPAPLTLREQLDARTPWDELDAILTQNEKDAERYRWLRDQWDRADALERVMLSNSADGKTWVGGGVLDQRIDAAISASNKEGAA